MNGKAGIRLNKHLGFFVLEAGGHDKLTFGEKDCRNYVEKIRRLELGEEDVITVQKYFLKMQRENSNFFYMMDLIICFGLRQEVELHSKSLVML